MQFAARHWRVRVRTLCCRFRPHFCDDAGLKGVWRNSSRNRYKFNWKLSVEGGRFNGIPAARRSFGVGVGAFWLDPSSLCGAFFSGDIYIGDLVPLLSSEPSQGLRQTYTSKYRQRELPP